MVNVSIKNPMDLIDKLTEKDVFDAFFLEEAEINGLVSYNIRANNGSVLYKTVREHIAYILKNDEPSSFNITLHAGSNYTKRLQENEALSDISAAIGSPVVSIRLKNGELTAITGISYNTFVLSKKADEIWDKDFMASLSALKIDFLIL